LNKAAGTWCKPGQSSSRVGDGGPGGAGTPSPNSRAAGAGGAGGGAAGSSNSAFKAAAGSDGDGVFDLGFKDCNGGPLPLGQSFAHPFPPRDFSGRVERSIAPTMHVAGPGQAAQLSDLLASSHPVVAVPEPGTWTLMLAGFGLPAARLRRNGGAMHRGQM
jgi:hypothetical protein